LSCASELNDDDDDEIYTYDVILMQTLRGKETMLAVRWTLCITVLASLPAINTTSDSTKEWLCRVHCIYAKEKIVLA